MLNREYDEGGQGMKIAVTLARLFYGLLICGFLIYLGIALAIH